jgi:hypothetical protein
MEFLALAVSRLALKVMIMGWSTGTPVLMPWRSSAFGPILTDVNWSVPFGTLSFLQEPSISIPVIKTRMRAMVEFFNRLNFKKERVQET